MVEKIEDLVVRAQAGDGEAYQRIYERFERMALSYAYSILGDKELAEDARQEAFLKAYCDLMSLREPAAFPGWFRTIVRRYSLSMVRGRRNVLTVPLEDAPDLASADPGPLGRASERQTRHIVKRALARLPAEEAEAARLYYLDQMTLSDIGDRLGLPVSTLKSRLHVARGRLRHRLLNTVGEALNTKRRSGDPQPIRMASAEAVERLGQQVETLLRVPGPEQYREAGELICARGRLLRFLGRPAEALEAFERGEGLPSLGDDPAWRARWRVEIGLTQVQAADFEVARRHLDEARAALTHLGEGQARLLAAAENGLGLCAWGVGDFPKARTHYESAERLSRDVQNPSLEAEANNNLALLDWKAGRLERALKRFAESLSQWRKLRNRHARALTLMNMGVIEENLGHAAAARRRYQEALKAGRELGFVALVSATEANLANLALGEGHWTQARDHGEQALAQARQGGDRRAQAIALENLSLAELGMKQIEKARQHLAAARRLAVAIGDRERQVSLDLVEAEALIAEMNGNRALECLERAAAQVEAAGYVAERPRLGRLEGGGAAGCG